MFYAMTWFLLRDGEMLLSLSLGRDGGSSSTLCAASFADSHTHTYGRRRRERELCPSRKREREGGRP